MSRLEKYCISLAVLSFSALILTVTMTIYFENQQRSLMDAEFYKKTCPTRVLEKNSSSAAGLMRGAASASVPKN